MFLLDTATLNAIILLGPVLIQSAHRPTRYRILLTYRGCVHVFQVESHQ